MLDSEWKLARRAELGRGTQKWEYRLAGTDLEGDPLTLKVAVNEEMQRITIITKF